jgi:hypothetical protein
MAVGAHVHRNSILRGQRSLLIAQGSGSEKLGNALRRHTAAVRGLPSTGYSVAILSWPENVSAHFLQPGNNFILS